MLSAGRSPEVLGQRLEKYEFTISYRSFVLIILSGESLSNFITGSVQLVSEQASTDMQEIGEALYDSRVLISNVTGF